MKVYYFRSTEPNFGDDLNTWIWNRLLPDRISASDNDVLLGIGTIIGQFNSASHRKLIFTSGAGYSPNVPDVSTPDWKVIAVRGPLTSAVLGTNQDKVVTDGAILVSQFPEFFTARHERKGVVFMPHLSAARAVDWRPLCEAAGIGYLDPSDDQFSLLKCIGRAELVLADAMHAAIVADSLRVPWIPLSTSSETNTFKWVDWTLSMSIPYRPVNLNSTSLLQCIRTLVVTITLQRHRLRDASPAKVIEAYQKRARRKKIMEITPLRQLSYLCLWGYRRASNIRWLSRPRFNIKKNIALLSKLRKEPGFLSDNKVFEERVAEVRKRLVNI